MPNLPKNKQLEREVKILVGQDSICADPDTRQQQQHVLCAGEQFDKKPSARIDYSQLTAHEGYPVVDEYVPSELLTSQDVSTDDFYANLTASLQSEIMQEEIATTGEYRVKHKSEKFVILPKPSNSNSAFSSSI